MNFFVFIFHEFFVLRSFAQESTVVDGAENKIKELIKHELEKVICIFVTNIILDT